MNLSVLITIFMAIISIALANAIVRAIHKKIVGKDRKTQRSPKLCVLLVISGAITAFLVFYVLIILWLLVAEWYFGVSL